MKRTFFNKSLIGLFASLSLLVSACGSTELSEYTSREYETYVGEFKSLGGVKVHEIVTHLFETEEGEILYAYSDRYDLDDDTYFGKPVEAYGTVSVYEELDKPLFEVKRITDAPEEEETSEEVTDVEYQDPDLGFSMTYPSNWELTTSVSSVTLTAPLSEEIPSADEEVEETETVEQSSDRIFVANLGTVLTKTSEDSQEDRATEVRSYVSSNYADLAGVQSELTYVGPDQLFSVRYKTEDGSTLYFIPRSAELFELSYYHESESDDDRLNNGNIFASLVSGFRFTTIGEIVEETEEVEENTEEEVGEEPEESTEETTTSGEQVSFSSYRELESKTFQFKMSYPGNWYYSGSSTGYNFGDGPQDEEDAESIIQMNFNQSTSEGVSKSGSTVSITVKVDERYYTLTGPSEYQSVMQTMADSIVSTQE